jgi:hypothetical protein
MMSYLVISRADGHVKDAPSALIGLEEGQLAKQLPAERIRGRELKQTAACREDKGKGAQASRQAGLQRNSLDSCLQAARAGRQNERSSLEAWKSQAGREDSLGGNVKQEGPGHPWWPFPPLDRVGRESYVIVT